MPFDHAADKACILSRESLPDPEPGISLSFMTYSSQGLAVNGYLAVPKGEPPYPGLVYCRGGIGKVGMVKIERIVPIAKRGFAVFAPFYRGYGNRQGRDEFGGEDRFDVYNAIAVMQSLPEVRSGAIPLIGFSRGAVMALLAAKECEAAGPVVVWGGVSDLFLTYEERVDLRRMLKRVVGHPQKQAEKYRSRSAVYWAGDIRTPVLIVHGTNDVQVSVEHATRLANALKTAGKPYELRLYEGLGHHFPNEANEQALDYIHQWIRENMT